MAQVGQTQVSNVLPPEFDRRYPVIVRGDGVWLEDSTGNRYLDAMSGGSMAATLGHGRRDIIAAARRQAERLAYVHNERLTTPLQEALAAKLVSVAPSGFTRTKFVTGGSEANETAIRLARSYHVERGEHARWQIISPAQAYHGPTFQTLALTGRPGLQGALVPYLPRHAHLPPSTTRLDPSGQDALAALDRVLDEVGPQNVSAFFCEPISAAALPAYSPPRAFWEGLARRREEHGFLICFDEVVTGMGRTGRWFAASDMPLIPDIIATAKGLGAGYAAIGAVLCTSHVYDAVANGSGHFSLGHTWDGAPLSCAVGLAVMEALESEGLLRHVGERGPRLRDELAAALADVPIVREVRGHGFLLGVEYADPDEPGSFLPPALRVAGRVDDEALARGLVTLSTQPTRDGYAGDQSLFAPSFTTTEDELGEMISRFAGAVREVSAAVERERSVKHTTARPSSDKAGSIRALVIEHELVTPGGLILEWLDELGAETDVLRIYEDDRTVDPRDYDLVISLGSEFAAHDEHIPWIDRERDLLIEASKADVPILGVCFGGQLLARALGGDSFRAEESEIGWLPVQSHDSGLVSDGPWFQWHFDSFRPPAGARVIAESDAGPQAYVVGKSLGVQFHPEVTPEIMETWVRVYRHELDAEGIDAESLINETDRLAEMNREASLRLLNSFFEQVAGLRGKA